MSPPTRYREIEVAGTPMEMGLQIGEAPLEESLCVFWLDAVCDGF